jgi:hypothetical protein
MRVSAKLDDQRTLTSLSSAPASSAGVDVVAAVLGLLKEAITAIRPQVKEGASLAAMPDSGRRTWRPLHHRPYDPMAILLDLIGTEVGGAGFTRRMIHHFVAATPDRRGDRDSSSCAL